MDFGTFVFTPTAVDELLASGVVLGGTVGLLFTILTLFYPRLRG